MCQVRDNEYEESLMTHNKVINNTNAQCNKCEEKAIILVGTNGKFCRQCFIDYFTHKFRGALGKHGTVRYGDKVAVAFSGGPSSSALLHILLKETSPDNPKKLKFVPGIIYIDERSILGKNHNEEYHDIVATMENSKLPYSIIPIEKVLNSSGKFKENTDLMKENFIKLFESITTLTGKEDLLYKLRYRLLSSEALALGYQHVFMAETSTRLAINILSNIAQGRGAHISLDTAFCDNIKYPSINILRPIRDVSLKEVAVYNTIYKVQTVVMPTFTTSLSAKASIRRLTEDFVLGLSRNFPATETTVYRTGNKIKSTMKLDTQCRLCCSPLDTQASDVLPTTAKDALKFTEKLSMGHYSSKSNPKLPDNMCINNKITGYENGDGDHIQIVGLTLCHGCSILQREFKAQNGDDDDNLTFSSMYNTPHNIVDNKPCTTKELEEKLGDFLLT